MEDFIRISYLQTAIKIYRESCNDLIRLNCSLFEEAIKDYTKKIQECEVELNELVDKYLKKEK